MTRLTLPFTSKVTLEKGLVGGTTVDLVVAGLADVADAFGVVWLLGGTVVR